MNIKEAEAWLQGARSMTNSIPYEPYETWVARVAEADAAMFKQAYWIIKAHKDRLAGRIVGTGNTQEDL